MNRDDYLHVQAEAQFLRERLAGLPETARITLLSAEARLRSLEAQLSEAETAGREPARARLTFRGRPVIGSHGVFAEFGMKATTAFVDVVSKVAAALTGPLATMGPVPNRDANQLLITSTAIGSFGFELEEYRDGQLPFAEDSPAAQAFELTQLLLQSTIGTDDELADSAAATDPRALASVRNFLEVLASNEAVCTFDYRGRSFRFSDVGQVRRSLARIGQDNLHEEQTSLSGEFQGVLPKGRNFEFKLADRDEVVRGKVGPAIADPEIINRHLHQPATIQVLATRVGNGKPRYVLTAVPAWQATAEKAADSGLLYRVT